MRCIVESQRLALRRWSPDDAEAFLAIFGDARVMRYTTIAPLADMAAARLRLDQLVRFETEHGFGQWAVIERGSGGLVGSCGFRAGERDELEVGFAVAPWLWRRGYATEIARVCVRYGLDVMRAPTVSSLTMPDNVAARRVLDKIGLSYRGMQIRDDAEWCMYATE
jgi:RimJ/RimL family protein N-acetyltransferase